MHYRLPFKYNKSLKKNKLYYIIAGEASGDLHGSNLITSIRSLDPGIRFRGLGGPLMNQCGLTSLASFNQLSIMGFVEIIKELRFFIKLKKTIINDILISKPQKIILIDYPGFNLRIAKSIKRLSSIPIIYYVSPQVWAWKENRTLAIKKYIDTLVVLFPFEKPWFKTRQIDVQYFGHPLVDLYREKLIFQKKATNNLVGLFPGSRLQEIKKHVPILLKIVVKLLKINPNLKFVVSLAPGLPVSCLNQLCVLKNISLDSSESWNTFNKVSVAIVASGTATLECALSQTPFVVIYKTSFFSWFIAKLFLSVPYISIVNILANKIVVKEYLQYQISINNISSEIIKLLENPKNIRNSLLNVTNLLGDGSAYLNTAKYIVNFNPYV